jgi:hypothetical protein
VKKHALAIDYSGVYLIDLILKPLPDMTSEALLSIELKSDVHSALRSSHTDAVIIALPQR